MKEYKTYLISILCALITILPVIYIAQQNNSESNTSSQSLMSIYIVVLICLIIALFIIAFFGGFIKAVFKKQVENYTSFIYQRYKSAIEYIDNNGENVSLNTTIHVSNLNLFSRKNNTSNELFTDGYGKVLPEMGKGINAKLIKEEDNMLSYSTNFSKVNVIKNEHYTTFGAKYMNTFNREGSNFWEIKPKHYCRFYEFILIYPDPNKEIKLNFKTGERCKDGTCKNWKIDEDINYTTYTRFGKKIAKVLFYNIPNTEVRYIAWEFI